MKFYSDVLNKLFDTPDDLAEAEAQQAEVVAKQEAEKKAKADARAAAAKKVDEARAAKVAADKAAIEAGKNYEKELAEFCKEFGSYHYTINAKDGFNNLFDSFFNFYF